MDAREYMARKGIDSGREPERPNTLEEKAWARAREAGGQPPRAGTPHDWEDWEKHHEDLADAAEQIDQKIDHEAHRRAVAHSDQSAVQSFTPAAGDAVRVDRNEKAPGFEKALEPPMIEPAAPRIALFVLAILVPPLAVGLAGGGLVRIAINVLLTFLGWLPGVGHAFWWLFKKQRD
ncbi:YqaE/Pmp3 family membrane protein [Halomonas sp. TRM85114]|nr:YqaE/Pmp3 family membrane protein [Halomonas jincaotanensis]